MIPQKKKKKYVLKTAPPKAQEHPAKIENQQKTKGSEQPLGHTNQNRNEKEGTKKMSSAKKDAFTFNSDVMQLREELIADVGGLINSNDSRKIRDGLRKINKFADKIRIKYALNKPLILVQFEQSEERRRESFSYLLKFNSFLRKDDKLISHLFSAFYKRIHEKYVQIGYIAELFSPLIRKPFYFDITDDIEVRKNYQFYYFIENFDPICKINFLFFDSNKNTLELDSEKIEDFKSDLKAKKNPKFRKGFNAYKDFYQNQIMPQNTGNMDGYNPANFQIQSDNEERDPRKIEELSADDLYQMIKKRLKIIKQVDEDDEEDTEQERKIKVRELKLIRNRISEEIEKQKQNKKALNAYLKQLIISQKQFKSKLKILLSKEEIFKKLNQNSIVILEGETGSGKSTQIPQLLCEYFKVLENSDALPILITEPRKLATRSLAERVSSELQQPIHGFVDYMTTSCSPVNQSAKVIFKLDRLVLDDLKEDLLLTKYSCLVIDEAHERTMGIDIILGLVSNIVKHRNDFKVIIMSASMNVQLFENYFKSDALRIPGRIFNVQKIHKPYSSELNTINKIKKLFKEELLNENNNLRPKYKGHILIFCESIRVIEILEEYFQKQLNSLIFKVMPLHGRLTFKQQKQIFNPSQQNKIILATRIAETSITIDGIKVVIDPGYDFEEEYNHRTKIMSMKLMKISKSSAKQRSGRAGRTGEGFCFSLYENNFLQHENKRAQINNMPLDIVVLRLKSLRIIESITEFPFIEAPSKTDIMHSIQILKNLGCLNYFDEKITEIGDYLVKIPIQPTLSRAIFEALIFQQSKQQLVETQIQSLQYFRQNICEEVIKILCLSIYSSNLFKNSMQIRENVEKSKFQNFSELSGDFLLFKEIMLEYESEKDQRKLRKWLNQQYLSREAFDQAIQLKEEIEKLVERLDMKAVEIQETIRKAKNKFRKCQNVKEVILSCLLTSFAAQVCVYSGDPLVGYTCLSDNLKLPIRIYGTSILESQGYHPKWIIADNFYQNQNGQTYCKIAQQLNYDFILSNMDPQLIDQYQIKAVNAKNIFYLHEEYLQPTYIFRKIKSNLVSGKKTAVNVQNKYHYIFDEDANKIKVFIKRENQEMDKLALKEVEDYFKSFHSQTEQNRSYNYIGPIDIKFSDGLVLENIVTDEKQDRYLIKTKRSQAYAFQRELSIYGNIQIHGKYFLVYLHEKASQEEFNDKLDRMMQYWKSCGYEASYQKDVINKRHRVPQLKLQVRFWAAKKDKSDVLIYFRNAEINLQKMQKILVSATLKCSSEGDKFFKEVSISITSKNDAIILYKTKDMFFDEVEVEQKIAQMRRKGWLQGFQNPDRIIKLRKPLPPQSYLSDQEWENQFIKLLNKVKLDQNNCCVKVWRRMHKYYGNNVVWPQYSRTDFFGEVRSSNTEALRIFADEFDNSHCLGSQKIHAKIVNELTVTIVDKLVFDNCQQEYLQLQQNLKREFYGLAFIAQDKKIRNTFKKIIKIKNKGNKIDLLKPALEIKKIFEAKTINDKKMFQYLFRYERQGDEILDAIEAKFTDEQKKTRVKFVFDKQREIINLYCDDEVEKQVIQQLKNRLQKVCIPLEINYSGKNLNKIQQIIEKLNIERPRNKKIRYTIKYTFKKIVIFADKETSKLLDEEISKQTKNTDASHKYCQICQDLVNRPYKLLNCQHNFCLICLSAYLKDVSNTSDKEYFDCPECSSKINILDIESIFSFEEFGKLCDSQLMKYIEKTGEYHKCYSENCDNIFETKLAQTNRYFDCNICGIWYCIDCKESHKDLDCQAWKKEMKRLKVRG